MGNLYQIIQLYTFLDNGTAHRGAVDTGIGTNFNIVFNGYDADLWNFLIAVGRGSKTKAVSSYHGTGVQYHVGTNLAVVINRYVRVEQGVAADFDVVADASVCHDLRMVADDDVLAYVHEWFDVTILPDLSRCGNRCQ